MLWTSTVMQLVVSSCCTVRLSYYSSQCWLSYVWHEVLGMAKCIAIVKEYGRLTQRQQLFIYHCQCTLFSASYQPVDWNATSCSIGWFPQLPLWTGTSRRLSCRRYSACYSRKGAMLKRFSMFLSPWILLRNHLPITSLNCPQVDQNLQRSDNRA